ncbi:hypothetical protein GCM10009761_07290 [Agromyces terreus]
MRTCWRFGESLPDEMVGLRRLGGEVAGQRHIRQHMDARAGIMMPVVLRASGAIRERAVSVMSDSQSDGPACVNP